MQLAFHERLRRERLRTGRSQADFASIALGMHPTHYNKLETGAKRPTLLDLHRISEGLGIPLAEVESWLAAPGDEAAVAPGSSEPAGGGSRQEGGSDRLAADLLGHLHPDFQDLTREERADVAREIADWEHAYLISLLAAPRRAALSDRAAKVLAGLLSLPRKALETLPGSDP